MDLACGLGDVVGPLKSPEIRRESCRKLNLCHLPDQKRAPRPENWLGVPPDVALNLPGGVGDVLGGLGDVVGVVLVLVERQIESSSLFSFFLSGQSVRAYFFFLLLLSSLLLL